MSSKVILGLILSFLAVVGFGPSQSIAQELASETVCKIAQAIGDDCSISPNLKASDTQKVDTAILQQVQGLIAGREAMVAYVAADDAQKLALVGEAIERLRNAGVLSEKSVLKEKQALAAGAFDPSLVVEDLSSFDTTSRLRAGAIAGSAEDAAVILTTVVIAGGCLYATGGGGGYWCVGIGVSAGAALAFAVN